MLSSIIVNYFKFKLIAKKLFTLVEYVQIEKFTALLFILATCGTIYSEKKTLQHLFFLQ